MVMRPETLSALFESRPRLNKAQIRRSQVGLFFERIYSVLFGSQSRRCQSASDFSAEMLRVEADLVQMLTGVGLDATRANDVADEFFQAVAGTSNCLSMDAHFIHDNDPACRSVEEVVLAYPGFYAICAYRLGHILHRLDVPLVPRLITEHAHERTGVDIHPGALIGCPFFIDHGTGIVIGETAQLGDRVKLYQGVTLGALSVRKDRKWTRRHPTLGDDVVIYANATVLGGDTVVGERSVVGGNVWLTSSVPPGSLVYHTSTVGIRRSDSAVPSVSEAKAPAET